MALDTASKNIEGIADLVVCAPIKQGFIDAFENITYETRLRFATDAFYQMRLMAREYEPIKPFTDVAERIQSLLAFRVGVIDTKPQRSLILAATFDRAFEPYIRLIWNPLGTFLDVLFCNCEGYVTAYDHSFEEYAAWVRANQVDSTIFYATTPLTVSDQLYLGKLESLQREGRSSDIDLARMTADDPEDLARRVRDASTSTAGDAGLQERFLTMASEAMVVLYQLAAYYPPDRPQGDGKYLLRAARDLFAGWDTTDPNQLPIDVRAPHAEAFAWLETSPPGPPDLPADPPFDRTQVQAGVLSGFDRPDAMIKHGCLMLLGVADAEAARAFIATLIEEVAWEGDERPRNEEEVFVNLAVTKRGLANLGVPDAVIDRFPKEFRDGMDQRAGLIGDIHANHPRNWPLPRRFSYAVGAPPSNPGPDASIRPRVELSEIDLVVQMRTARGSWDYVQLPNDEDGLRASAHPLAAIVLEKLALATAAGIRLLSLEPMRRLKAEAQVGERVRDHFGFADLISQPSLAEDNPPAARDAVSRGELVLGYRNDRGDPPLIEDPANPDPSIALLRDGSFLAIRKMSQDVGALNDFLANPPGANPSVTGDALLAKMAGRRRDGTPLVAGGAGASNDFDFSADPNGDLCPFQAHIRRANPRLSNVGPVVPPPFGRPTPRIMRRGMSYGPDYADQPNAPRGVMFMAYNASLTEQFEVIQRWINGGNSTNVAAAQNDPLIGAPPPTGAKTFRFPGDGVVRVDIQQPFVGIEWGLYAFAPSRAALSRIARSAPTWPIIGRVENGEAIIKALRAMPEDQAKAAWKVYLEDFTAKDPAERAETPDIWAAIRDRHDGVLRIPDAVLVASSDLVQEVFLDPRQRYSVAGEALRMQKSFGEIYVGLDPGPRYDHESIDTNAAIGRVTRADAFAVAYQVAQAALRFAFGTVARISADHQAPYPVEIDLRDDFITPALGVICNIWFGIPDVFDPALPPPPVPGPKPGFVKNGGWNWELATKRLPQCPGDFMAPSRYCFYPEPTEAIRAYGIVHGAALRAASRAYVDAIRPSPPGGPAIAPTGQLTAAMCGALDDNDLVARNLIGIMVGALPPLDANLRFVLYDWIKEKTLWRHQERLLADAAAKGAGDAVAAWASSHLAGPMTAAMQKRPAPDLLWRTAVKAHRLGDVEVNLGDKIILSVVSATLERQNRMNTGDVSAIFGGLRSTTPHPVHACPAYEMAMGTMLGMLTALFEAGQIEVLPGGSLLVKLTPPPSPPRPAKGS